VSPIGADDGFAIDTTGWTIQAYAVGREREPVLVIDGVLADPDALVEAAAQASFSPLKPGGNFYPGRRAPAPKTYAQALYAALRPVIGPAFGVPVEGRVKMTCALSLATLKPVDLVLAQRLPHFDTADGGQIAVLHYLCGGDQGGTAFYRHRSTGFETITPDRTAPYVAALEAEIAAAPPPQAYVSGDTPLFEQIGRVEARMNRIAVYRSRLLHAGEMGSGCRFSDNPRHGRLTANSFLFF
jgi:hypothetical protein